MRNGFENLRLSPASTSSRESTPILYQEIPFNGRALQIWTADEQLRFTITANEKREVIGRLETERLVCNSVNVRLISITGPSDVKDLLRQSLDDVAKSKEWNVFLSDRLDAETRAWLEEKNLLRLYQNPRLA